MMDKELQLQKFTTLTNNNKDQALAWSYLF